MIQPQKVSLSNFIIAQKLHQNKELVEPVVLQMVLCLECALSPFLKMVFQIILSLKCNVALLRNLFYKLNYGINMSLNKS